MRKPAPDFELPDQDGKMHRLADYRGQWVVLYFYPYDRSLNCTKEACHFRDEYQVIHQFGNAIVIGVNRGSVSKHKKFSDKHHLNFPLLSDKGHVVTSAYGAWRQGSAKIYDRPFGTRRNTYLIDPECRIAKTYMDVNPNTHAEAVISDLQSFQK